MDTVTFAFRQPNIVLKIWKFIGNKFFTIIFTRTFVQNIDDTTLVDMDMYLSLYSTTAFYTVKKIYLLAKYTS